MADNQQTNQGEKQTLNTIVPENQANTTHLTPKTVQTPKKSKNSHKEEEKPKEPKRKELETESGAVTVNNEHPEKNQETHYKPTESEHKTTNTKNTSTANHLIKNVQTNTTLNKKTQHNTDVKKTITVPVNKLGHQASRGTQWRNQRTRKNKGTERVNRQFNRTRRTEHTSESSDTISAKSSHTTEHKSIGEKKPVMEQKTAMEKLTHEQRTQEQRTQEKRPATVLSSMINTREKYEETINKEQRQVRFAETTKKDISQSKNRSNKSNQDFADMYNNGIEEADPNQINTILNTAGIKTVSLPELLNKNKHLVNAPKEEQTKVITEYKRLMSILIDEDIGSSSVN